MADKKMVVTEAGSEFYRTRMLRAGAPITLSGPKARLHAALGYVEDKTKRRRRPQLDHDGDGDPGGSRAAEPPALSSMTRAELIAQAEEEGVDVEAIEGTGADGNVIVADIRNAIEAKRNTPPE